LTVAGIGVAPSRAAAGEVTAAPSSEQTMVEWIDWVIRDIDTYWNDTFASYGAPWPGSTWVTADGADVWDSACGGPVGDPALYPEVSPAFYCLNDETVYLSAPFLYRTWLDSGDFGAAVVVAHEMGHHVQHVLGVENPPWSPNVQPLELQADCLAGVWAGEKERTGQLEPGDLDEGIATMISVGDYEIGSYQHHGTPEERADSFITGYDQGLDAC
jgi:predicted metalloprotease